MKFKEFYSYFCESKKTRHEYVFISKLFNELASSQRGGGPEEMFHNNVNPGVNHSSIFQWLAEHTGDLIHRASYPPVGSGFGGGGIGYGFGAVKEKVAKLFKKANEFKQFHKHYHTNPFLQSMENDFKFRLKEGRTDLTLEEYQTKFVNAAKNTKMHTKFSTHILNYKDCQEMLRLVLGIWILLFTG